MEVNPSPIEIKYSQELHAFYYHEYFTNPYDDSPQCVCLC